MLTQEFFAHIEAFLTARRREGKSGATIKAYAADLRELEGMLREVADEIDAQGGVGESALAYAVKRLGGRRLHPKSIARKMSAWRAYDAFLTEKGWQSGRIATDLRAPRAPKRLPKALNENELGRLLDGAQAQAQSGNDFRSARDSAMFETLYGLGLRVGELVGLDVGDVDLEELWAGVWGKGNKQRRVPVTEAAAQAIRAYLPLRQAVATGRALFVGERGGRMSERRVEQIVAEWARANGALTPVTPHCLRHSYATHVLRRTGDIRAVQELLGHSRISTTQIYTALDFGELLGEYAAHHPRAWKKPPGSAGFAADFAEAADATIERAGAVPAPVFAAKAETDADADAKRAAARPPGLSSALAPQREGRSDVGADGEERGDDLGHRKAQDKGPGDGAGRGGANPDGEDEH